MPEGYYLTEADRALFEEMAEDYRRRRSGNTGRAREGSIEYEESQASDVYIAYTGEDGVPALSRGVASGTGSGDEADDIPGEVDLKIYRIVEEEGVSVLRRVGTLTKRVFNLSDLPVGPRKWVVVVKTKNGRWVVPTPGWRFGVCP